MTKPLIDPATDAALTDLDPARTAMIDLDRYESTLGRILATAADESPHDDPLPNLRRGRPLRRRRLFAVPAALLAAVAVVVGTTLVVGDQAAYADWTPVPEALSPAEATRADRTCLAYLQLPVAAKAAPLIADRRGPWVYVLVKTTATTEASCVMPETLVGASPDSSDRRIYGGAAGETLEDIPGPRHVHEQTAAVSSTDEGLFSWTEGAVGADVRAVTITTARGLRVTASVQNGRFAAWWPAGKNSARNPELTQPHILEATLSDGSTITIR